MEGGTRGGRSRELPRTSVGIRDVSGQRMEDVGLWGKKETKFIKFRRIGRAGRNIAASSLRQPQRKSVDVRGICVRKMGDGNWEIMRKIRPKMV